MLLVDAGSLDDLEDVVALGLCDLHGHRVLMEVPRKVSVERAGLTFDTRPFLLHGVPEFLFECMAFLVGRGGRGDVIDVN